MTHLDLKIIDSQLDAAIAAMKRIENSLGSLTSSDAGLAEACGHSKLAEAVRQFSDSWRLKREELRERTTVNRYLIEAVRTTTDRIDKGIADKLNEGKNKKDGEKEDGKPSKDIENDGLSGAGILPDPVPNRGPRRWSPDVPGVSGTTVKPNLEGTEQVPHDHLGVVSGGDSGANLQGVAPVAAEHPSAVGETQVDEHLDKVEQAPDRPVSPVEALAAEEALERRNQQEEERIRKVLGGLVDAVLTSGTLPEVLAASGVVSAVGALAAIALRSQSKEQTEPEVGKVESPADRIRRSLAQINQAQQEKPAPGATGPGREEVLARLRQAVAPSSAEDAASGTSGTGPGEASTGSAGTGDAPSLPYPETGPGSEGLLPGAGSESESGIAPELPSEAEDLGGEQDAGGAGGEGQSTVASTDDSSGDRNDMAMLGGMGMAAGMGGYSTSSRNDEKRSENARRLRDRLRVVSSNKKEPS